MWHPYCPSCIKRPKTYHRSSLCFLQREPQSPCPCVRHETLNDMAKKRRERELRGKSWKGENRYKNQKRSSIKERGEENTHGCIVVVCIISMMWITEGLQNVSIQELTSIIIISPFHIICSSSSSYNMYNIYIYIYTYISNTDPANLPEEWGGLGGGEMGAATALATVMRSPSVWGGGTARLLIRKLDFMQMCLFNSSHRLRPFLFRWQRTYTHKSIAHTYIHENTLHVL